MNLFDDFDNLTKEEKDVAMALIAIEMKNVEYLAQNQNWLKRNQEWQKLVRNNTLHLKFGDNIELFD